MNINKLLDIDELLPEKMAGVNFYLVTHFSREINSNISASAENICLNKYSDIGTVYYSLLEMKKVLVLSVLFYEHLIIAKNSRSKMRDLLDIKTNKNFSKLIKLENHLEKASIRYDELINMPCDTVYDHLVLLRGRL